MIIFTFIITRIAKKALANTMEKYNDEHGIEIEKLDSNLDSNKS